MFCLKRILLAGVLGCLAMPVCAFTFSYGTGIKVRGVEIKSGKLLLPLTHKKYRNVKIVSKDLFEFLKKCTDECVYPAAEIKITSVDYRRSFTSEDLMIVEVELNQDLILTFLVFQKANAVSVKAPETVQFTNPVLYAEIEKYLKELIGSL